MDLANTLKQCPEPLPDWLREPSPGFDRKDFFSSRTVYYPGFGNDGHPVSLCARAHAAHAFVYVDYGVSQENVQERVHAIGDPGFVGYTVEHEEELSESDLRPGGWTQHVEPRELQRDPHAFANVTPYGLFMVLRRNEDRDDSHGPERFAMLFIGGDGHATYDALYCQDDGTCPPFLVVAEDYGFGANYSAFAEGGLLESIAGRCDVHPKWLLVGSRGRGGEYRAWGGYRDSTALPEPGGMHGHLRRLFLREGRSVNPMAKPNLFDYAGKELSQDAVICWLIKWAGTQAETEAEQLLRELGHAFVDALLEKHEVSLRGSVSFTEIHRQNHGIDVLARVHDGETSHVLLIEDKTDTDQHSGQLDRYYQKVAKRESKLGEVRDGSIRPIFLKTGNQSGNKDGRTEKESKYMLFGRRDFLSVLEQYSDEHPIVIDFRQFLRRREAEFTRFHAWREDGNREDWSRGEWEGFFRVLECRLYEPEQHLPDWGYVSNPRGGFLGFWWRWSTTSAGDSLYLQLEIEIGNPEKQKLCFKVKRGRSDGHEARDRYHKAVLDAGRGKVERPSRMRVGRHMTVGVWRGDWLAFGEDARLDIDRTVRNLKAAERIIDDAAKNT